MILKGGYSGDSILNVHVCDRSGNGVRFDSIDVKCQTEETVIVVTGKCRRKVISTLNCLLRDFNASNGDSILKLEEATGAYTVDIARGK
jgi:hypothetical protein